MSGITTGTGLFSGIDTASLIEQLLAISARPRALAQKRMLQLQVKQSAILDINTSLSGLKGAAAAFRTSNPFDKRSASSSNIEVMTASASKAASPGSYSFIVDRLVSTQQMLSRGFADLDVSGLNAGTWSFEPHEARLDRDMSLSMLNGGLGVERGVVTITDSNNASAQVDLSRVATINEMLDAINSAAGINVTARVEGDRFVLVGAASVVSQSGRNTARDLGLDSGSASISGGKLIGASVYQMGSDTTLSSLNDGMGVNFGTDAGDTRYDFVITVDADGAGGDPPVDVRVNIGSKWGYEDGKFVEQATRATTVGGAAARINEALTAAGFSGVSASIDATNGRLVINGGAGVGIEVKDKAGGTSARDLGLLGTATGTLTGKRVLAGMNTTLLGNINGGAGLSGDQLDFTLRDGASLSIAGLSGATTVEQLMRLINDDATNAGRITASLTGNGTGIRITDTTGGSGNLVIAGDAAESLGIKTDPAGVASNTVRSTDLEHRYMSESTLLSSLKEGQGIGKGRFRITDALGGVVEISIDDSTQTLGHVIKKINDANIAVKARINSTGDGILIEEDTADGIGAASIKIEDVTGSTAKSLRIAGTSKGTGADNYIDGTMETHITFDATDTLKEVMTKINTSNAGVAVSAINTGSGANPYKLSITSRQSGTAGRFVLDTGDFNLGMSTLDAGHDARVFFGSADAASAVLISSSSNTMDGVISGVTIDLKSASETPVTLTVAQDQTSIETQIKSFVDSFNNLMKRISTQTRYVEETKEKGPLLGDGTMISMRNAVFNQLLAGNKGFSETFDQLSDVGLKIGSGGVLEFDKDRFRQAYEEDPAAVQAMFNRRVVDPNGNKIPVADGITGRDPNAGTAYSELGVIPQIEQFIDVYINSIDGVLTRKKDSIGSQIKLQQRDIDRINATLEIKRTKLTQQFAAMEQAIAQLQSQQSALSSIQLIG